MVNIREVARMAGVSPATVSRVINGTAKVSAEKRARVLEVIFATEKEAVAERNRLNGKT